MSARPRVDEQEVPQVSFMTTESCADCSGQQQSTAPGPWRGRTDVSAARIVVPWWAAARLGEGVHSRSTRPTTLPSPASVSDVCAAGLTFISRSTRAQAGDPRSFADIIANDSGADGAVRVGSRGEQERSP